jgi:hypothetical protein
MHLAILPVTSIFLASSKLVDAFSMSLVFVPMAFEIVAIGPRHGAFTVPHIVLPLSEVFSIVLEFVNTSSISFVFDEFSLVVISVRK